MKFIYSGSALIATALVASSVLIFVPTSIAEPLVQASAAEQALKTTQQESRPSNPSKTTETSKPSDKPVCVISPCPQEVGTESEPDFTGPSVTEGNASAIEKSLAKNDGETELPSSMFNATAYSLMGRTASGINVRKGIIAADRHVLPIGTRVRIESGTYSGEYEVCDTGGAVRGKRIDVWVPSTREAMRFGRRNVKLTVLSYPKKTVAKRSTTAKTSK